MAEYNLQDIQALIGQMIYDAFQKNLMEFTQFGGSVYSDIGMYPKDYIDNLGSGTPNGGYPSQRRYEFDETMLATKAQTEITNKLARDTFDENKRFTNLQDKLERDLEAGRITRAQLDATVQREQIASQNRIAEMENEVNQKLAAIRQQEVTGTLALGQGRLDLDKMLGLRSANKEDYLAKLQGTELEAGMAANPRDFIKLAFYRANQPVPPSLAGLSGMPNMPVLEEAKRGNVSVGPTFSTVGEKGFEYALLAPGSVIAPTSKKGEKSSMRNAVSAIYNQLAKSGVDPNTHKEFQTAQKGLISAEGGVTLPSGVTYKQVMEVATRASHGMGDAIRQLKTWFPNDYSAWLDDSNPFYPDFKLFLFEAWLGTDPAIPPDPDEPPPDAPPGEPPDEPLGSPGNPYLPKELGDIPFIQQLRRYSSPTPYVGTQNRYNPADNMTPINPYNAQVYFDLKNAVPTDIGMASAYQRSFGIPEDDFQYTAAQTARGFGLTPNNGRAALRPMFN